MNYIMIIKIIFIVACTIISSFLASMILIIDVRDKRRIYMVDLFKDKLTVSYDPYDYLSLETNYVFCDESGNYLLDDKKLYRNTLYKKIQKRANFFLGIKLWIITTINCMWWLFVFYNV